MKLMLILDAASDLPIAVRQFVEIWWEIGIAKAILGYFAKAGKINH